MNNIEIFLELVLLGSKRTRPLDEDIDFEPNEIPFISIFSKKLAKSLSKTRYTRIIENFGISKTLYDLMFQYQNQFRCLEEIKLMRKLPLLAYMTIEEATRLIGGRKS